MADGGKKLKIENEKEETDDNDDEEEEGDDDEYEDEDEPVLKYDRVGNDLQTIFQTDCASCMAVDTKFLALGTHWGRIHILDHMGTNISSKEFQVHSTVVNQISIDENGDFIASCSDDGQVVITGLYSDANIQRISFDRPIKTVALDPDYYKNGSGRQFATGDDRMQVYQKGMFNRTKSEVIHQGEGAVRNIKWKSSFIVWSNDLGVKVYDISSKKRITNISRDHDPRLRPELYQCSICFKDDRTFMIGWGDTIKVCKIRERPHDFRDLPTRYVEIVSMLKTDFYVCGLAPLESNILVLSYEPEAATENMVSTTVLEPGIKRPHLRVIEPSLDNYRELSNEALSIRGFELYQCKDYSLESLVEEKMFYIVSPKDVVVTKLRDLDDHIAWLLEHKQFEVAMEQASANESELKRHDIKDIGRRYLDYLLGSGQYDGAARLCVSLFGKSKALWEEEVYKFARIQQLKTIAPYLPRGEPKLDPAVYEVVLNEFLQTDEKGFCKLIKDWPSELYNIKSIVHAVLDKCHRTGETRTLLQCLAELYAADRQYDKALSIYLRIKDKNAFDLIHRHNLFAAVSEKLVILMEFDSERAVRLLLDNIDKITIHKVVDQLRKHKQFLHLYLDNLYRKDPHIGSEYHGLQVELYAEFDRKRLLPFLRSSNYLPLDKALIECEQRNLTPERVFLLGRMGYRDQALELIITELNDVGQAIDFCKEHVDMDLWNMLIDHSLQRPDFIKSLLHNIGTHVDPTILIKKIPPGLKIPDLRNSLVKILQDYNLQINLREGCKKILVADCYNLMERLVKTQRKGICIDENQTCQGCHSPAIMNDLRYAGNIMVFHCKHVFHEECLPTTSGDICSICNTQKRGPGDNT